MFNRKKFTADCRAALASHSYLECDLGGDFFGADRREWDPETQEGRYDVAKNMKLFEVANALYGTA